MKRIIIALGYNQSASKVVKAGNELVCMPGATITLVHVITEPGHYAAEYLSFSDSHTFYPALQK